MDVSLFGFSYNVTKFNGVDFRLEVVATNGPITVVFKVQPGGLVIDQGQTNVKVDHPNTARIALAAARWHRANSR